MITIKKIKETERKLANKLKLLKKWYAIDHMTD